MSFYIWRRFSEHSRIVSSQSNRMFLLCRMGRSQRQRTVCYRQAWDWLFEKICILLGSGDMWGVWGSKWLLPDFKVDNALFPKTNNAAVPMMQLPWLLMEKKCVLPRLQTCGFRVILRFLRLQAFVGEQGVYDDIGVSYHSGNCTYYDLEFAYSEPHQPVVSNSYQQHISSCFKKKKEIQLQKTMLMKG